MEEAEFAEKLSMFRHVRGSDAVLPGAYDLPTPARASSTVQTSTQPSVPSTRAAAASTSSIASPHLPRSARFPQVVETAARWVHARDRAGHGGEAVALPPPEALRGALEDVLYEIVGGASLEDLEELSTVALHAARPFLVDSGLLDQDP
jgi:hypothetical protein